MLDDDASVRQDVLLSVQRALLESVTSNLRGLAVDWDKREFRLVGYYHGPISDDDREEMSCVDTEVAADFLDIAPVDFVLERVDMPTSITSLASTFGPDGRRAWAFLRKE